MGKLHELLAVEGDLSNTADKVIAEAVNTFTKKNEHFMGQVRSVVMFDDSRSGENATEEKALVTTVQKKLDYVSGMVSKYWDAILRKEQTNQKATADLIFDGEVVYAALPATFLLGMESRLKKLRVIYEAIPTLNPNAVWELDTAAGEGIYRSPTTANMRTEKTVKHKILYEATKEHPAQIEKWNEDVPIGRIESTVVSGMFTPAEKSRVIGRIDQLIRAVKQARQRANDTKVENTEIGAKLFELIHG